jgi:hypothetical protein
MPNNNPNQHYQKIVKPTLQYNNTILKEIMWKNTNMNLTAANLYETIKLHKPGMPIRPISN